MEIWKDVLGYEGLYQVSNYGRVKSFPRQGGFSKITIIKQHYHTKGYLQITLYKKGIGKKHRVHRLVAIHFIKNPKNKKEVNHINGIKDNNHVNNLEWNTAKENSYHKINILGKTGILKSHLYFRSRKVNQYDLKGNFIKTWECIKYAKDALGIKHISNCCSGKRKTAGGFKWKYFNN